MSGTAQSAAAAVTSTAGTGAASGSGSGAALTAVPAGAAAAAGSGNQGTVGTTTTTPAHTEWTSTFNDDVKNFVTNKGWKDSAQVVDSYRNLEKLVGAPQDQIIKMPAGDAAPEAWNEVYARLGRPDKPDGYTLETPKGESPDFAKVASEWFHKAGLNKAQAKALNDNWNGFQAAQKASMREAQTQKAQAETLALRKEWGAAHDQNIMVAQRAFRESGLDAKVLDAMDQAIGPQATMKFFHSIGSKFSEAVFHTGTPGGNSQNGPLTPVQAKTEIAKLRGDSEFVKKYIAGDVVSKMKMETLHKYAYPES